VIPAGEPRRYRSSHGYIRLRWRVGQEYVETYEHRVFAGRVTDEEHVHHVNHVKTDNSPGNLRPLTSGEHTVLHSIDRIPVYGRTPHNKGKIAVLPWHEAAAAMYPKGFSTYEIGKRLRRDPASVYRALIKLGVPLRKEARIAIPNRERETS
jgi:hypothetical protein